MMQPSLGAAGGLDPGAALTRTARRSVLPRVARYRRQRRRDAARAAAARAAGPYIACLSNGEIDALRDDA